MTKDQTNKRVTDDVATSLEVSGWVRGRYVKPESKARMQKNLVDLMKYGRGGVPITGLDA